MAQYYILSKQSDVDALYENLSQFLCPQTVTVRKITDNSEIMPSKYISINTELLSDAGLLNAIKQITDVYCNGRKIKVVKELEGHVPLV
jgi:hypothetical protein